ncbi:MAG: endonuclease/exonuclease/phosphatase family protein [Candidatus Vecturithrix sp.]|nr:endonuclease/exonuclease/phosphatase family protein [Candidatus Vecturithrix sp.]
MSCGITTNFLESDAPKFTGYFAQTHAFPDGLLKVVTFNIAGAKKIDCAIEEMRNFKELQDADILLLQEMDETGTARIAKALHYNYVYYPIAIHRKFKQYFGNAILSKWPIQAEEKVLLPHANPKDQQRRIAASATLRIGNEDMKVYSVHTETIWLSEDKRYEQVKALVEHIAAQQEFAYIIVGGDFNTVWEKDVNANTLLFNVAHLDRASAGVGATASPFLQLDHIYTRGLRVIESGRVKQSQASDHDPVWVLLEKQRLLSLRQKTP